MSDGPVTDRMAVPVTATVCISNKRGLHARASAKFCALANSWDAVVRVSKDGVEVGGCSIMGLLILGASKGSEISITATGVQAEEAVSTLVRLVNEKFGEED